MNIVIRIKKNKPEYLVMNPEHKSLKFWFKFTEKESSFSVVCFKIGDDYHWWKGYGNSDFKFKESLPKKLEKELDKDGCVLVSDMTENLLSKKDLLASKKLYDEFQAKQITKANRSKLISSANDEKKGSELLAHIDEAVKQELEIFKSIEDKDKDSSDGDSKVKGKVSKSSSSTLKQGSQESTRNSERNDSSKSKSKSKKNKSQESDEESESSEESSGSSEESSESESSSSDEDLKKKKKKEKEKQKKRKEKELAAKSKNSKNSSGKASGKTDPKKSEKIPKADSGSSDDSEKAIDDRTHTAQSAERITASINKLDKIIKSIRNG